MTIKIGRKKPDLEPTEQGEPLHTKLRPKTLDKVIGQKAVCASLQRALNSPNKPHAFLLTGPSGTGKTTIARIVASMLGVPLRGVLEVDAATNSGVENMRAVTEMVRYKSLHSDGGKRFIIVDEAQACSKATWQSMLKPIEEPPAHVYWAFCTTEPDKVPETIRTRCSTYNLAPISSDDIEEMLSHVNEQERLGLPDDIIGAIARNCNGSARKALVALSQLQGVTDKKEAMRLLETGVAEEAQAVELARMLCLRKGLSWPNAMKLCEALKLESPEGVRLVVVNYAASMLPTARDPEALLAVLEAFQGPYNPSERMAPLYTSIGRLLWS